MQSNSFLMLLGLICLFQFPSFAQNKDVEGSKDHPEVKRYFKSCIKAYDEVENRDYYYVIGPANHQFPDYAETKRDLYKIKADHIQLLNYKIEPKVADFELMDYFSKQLLGCGYQLLYRCDKEGECGIGFMWNFFTGANPYNFENGLHYGLTDSKTIYAVFQKAGRMAVVMTNSSAADGESTAVLHMIKTSENLTNGNLLYAFRDGVNLTKLPEHYSIKRTFHDEDLEYVYPFKYDYQNNHTLVKKDLISTLYFVKGQKDKAVFNYLKNRLIAKEEDGGLEFELVYQCTYEEQCGIGMFLEMYLKDHNYQNVPTDFYQGINDINPIYGVFRKGERLLVLVASQHNEDEGGHVYVLAEALGSIDGMNMGIDHSLSSGSQDVNTNSTNDDEIVDDALEDYLGGWKSSWGDMVIEFKDGRVIGTYTHDEGRLDGVLENGVFKGTWKEAPSYSFPDDGGEVILRLSEDKQSFKGKWRYGNSGAWNEDWTGYREK